MRKCLYIMLAALMLLPGCGKEAEGKKPSESITIGSIVSVNIISDIGEVTVSGASGPDITIEAAYRIEAPTKERRSLIEESVLVTNDTTDPSVLTVLSRVNENTMLAENEKAIIDLTVRVPKGIGSVVIQASTGNVLVDGIKGCQSIITCQEGDITVKNTELIGSSSITNMVGDISVNLKSISKADDIKVYTDMGAIRFNCPQTSVYTVTVEENSQPGSTWLSRKQNKAGGTKLHLAAKIGSVKFQK